MIEQKEIVVRGIRFSHTSEGREIGHAYLYIMRNDLHQEPFGLLEDVAVEESKRGKGIGSALVREVIATARHEGCYKLVATSRLNRPLVHQLYLELGFQDYGKEFRMDF